MRSIKANKVDFIGQFKLSEFNHHFWNSPSKMISICSRATPKQNRLAIFEITNGRKRSLRKKQQDRKDQVFPSQRKQPALTDLLQKLVKALETAEADPEVSEWSFWKVEGNAFCAGASLKRIKKRRKPGAGSHRLFYGLCRIYSIRSEKCQNLYWPASKARS